MATGYRSEVTRIIRASTLWDESDCSQIPGIKKGTGIEEVLDCLYYISPYYFSCCFEKTIIVSIKIQSFIFRDTPHRSLYVIRREMQVEGVFVLDV